jgi:hypothetical protein
MPSMWKRIAAKHNRWCTNSQANVQHNRFHNLFPDQCESESSGHHILATGHSENKKLVSSPESCYVPFKVAPSEKPTVTRNIVCIVNHRRAHFHTREHLLYQQKRCRISNLHQFVPQKHRSSEFLPKDSLSCVQPRRTNSSSCTSTGRTKGIHLN